MNWYKISQLVNVDQQSEHLLGGPSVHIQPYEGAVNQAVNELQEASPGLFSGVTDIFIDMGHGQFGSVSSDSPNSVRINLDKIKSNASTQLGQPFNPSDEMHQKALVQSIKQVLIHEISHVNDFDSTNMENPFPGGEGVADRATEDWMNSMPSPGD